MRKIGAVILAAGAGSRMKSEKTKQKMLICGKSILQRSLLAFEKSEYICEIVVVARKDEIEFAERELSCITKPSKAVVGGSCRQESARLGFLALSTDCDFVAIHDAARCLVTARMIDAVAGAAIEYGAATAASSVHDTVKRVDKDGFILSTEDRNMLRRAATPQIFSYDIYKEAISSPEYSLATDDNMLVEHLGHRIFCVDTGNENMKITELSDIAVAEKIIKSREEQPCMTDMDMDIRIGHGYDVHRLAPDRRLIIGGVEIPHSRGLLGHSDADVLTHAVMDALLGAVGLGDIGKHFPDTSGEFKDINSMILLEKVRDMLSDKGYAVSNIDATVVIQKPKLAPFIQKMSENIASTLKINSDRVNIKATTEEKLGFTGSEEGASAHAVALVMKR